MLPFATENNSRRPMGRLLLFSVAKGSIEY